jgi:hypothetical protein
MATLKLEYGGVRLEYEGATDFELADIKSLLEHLATKVTMPTPLPRATPAAPAPSASGASKPSPVGAEMLHMNSVAAKLDAKTVTDLAIAAAAKAQIYDNLETFSKEDLLERMREATKYYKQSHAKNLGRSIMVLVGDKFNQRATDSYSLNAQAQTELESRLAQ